MIDKHLTTKIIIIKDKKILVLRRSKTDPSKPLTWDLPGGVAGPNEDPNIAIARETKEETGLTISHLKIIDVSSFFNDEVYIVRLIYSTLVSKANIKLSYEHDQFKWVEPLEFTGLDAPDYQRKAVESIITS